MKINEQKLQAAINLNPTKRSQTMTIADLSERIESGSLTVPLYQRGLSWNDAKAIALFNYQLFGKAPVSPISLNEIGTNDDVPQLSFISRKEIAGDNRGKLSVVDGQQRLTTNYKAYSNDASFSSIVFDFTQAKFRRANNGKANKSQIPVGVLFNKNQQTLTDYIYKHYSSNDATKLFPLLVGIRTKILNYSYTIHIADNMAENEQIEWFEVLNNAGSNVSLIELALSKLRMHDFDIYSGFITPYKKMVKDYGFGELFSPFSSNVSYPIASLNPAFEYLLKDGIHSKNYAPIPSDTKEHMLLKLTKEQLDNISELTLKALEEALDFIFDYQLQEYVKAMQYVMYLTGYFIFQRDNIQKDSLSNWVKKTRFDNLSNGERRSIYNKLINGKF
ncbi:DUF262 domain-containing protein [Limosilactobacillus fermentum]|uniref:DUF262 domain-containing protein n=1 Tax=Limosilactobacillus fermentum TaxID=1613 RepID=UPI002F263CE7